MPRLQELSGARREACKIKAIVRPDCAEAPFIDLNRCYDCRIYITACPFGAISTVG